MKSITLKYFNFFFMKPKSFYITILISLFYFAISLSIIFIGFKTKDIFSNLFSILLIIYSAWIGIKKFWERNNPIIYDHYRLLTAIILMLVIAAVLIYIAPNMRDTPLTQSQKSRMIIK